MLQSSFSQQSYRVLVQDFMHPIAGTLVLHCVFLPRSTAHPQQFKVAGDGAIMKSNQFYPLSRSQERWDSHKVPPRLKTGWFRRHKKDIYQRLNTANDNHGNSLILVTPLSTVPSSLILPP